MTDSDPEGGRWDVAVIGAGVAGSVLARETARRGLRTLLVDGRAFPRPKVCGGCLNPRALEALKSLGLERALASLGGEPIESILLRSGRRATSLMIPRGLSLTRCALDAMLLDAARAEGVTAALQTTATVLPDHYEASRQVTLRHAGQERLMTARIVIAADGLLRSSLRSLSSMTAKPHPASRLGVGRVFAAHEVPAVWAERCPRGAITMVVGRGGYVGLSWAEGNQLSVAAAVDPRFVKRLGSPAACVQDLLSSVGWELPTVEGGWQGTPPLTALPARNAAERLFVIGDAGGYVEPFTGEGMAAALEQAVAVAPLVAAGVREWTPTLADEWERLHRTRVRRRQRVCRMLSGVLRRPWLSQHALRLVSAFPRVADGVIDRISRPAPPAHPLLIDPR